MKLLALSVILVPMLGAGMLLAPICAARADQRALALLNKVQAANDAAKTLTANFSYVVTEPVGDKTDVKKDIGTIKLMKPNYADISFNLDTPYGRHIVSDGTTRWTLLFANHQYTKTPADAQGKNINVWRLITVGGFFSVYTWIRDGIYVDDLSELTYAGKETVEGVAYQVLEHKMVGCMQNKSCPFDQKIYIGSDYLIHRFTMAFTIDGKPGTEYAELTNLETGKPMSPSEFAFTPSPAFTEQAASSPVFVSTAPPASTEHTSAPPSTSP